MNEIDVYLESLSVYGSKDERGVDIQRTSTIAIAESLAADAEAKVEYAALRAKAALFDVLSARIKAGAWTIPDGVDRVTIAIRRTGERVHGATLAEAVEKAIKTEGGAQ